MRGYVGASLHICSQVELYVYTPEGKRLNIKKPAETLMYVAQISLQHQSCTCKSEDDHKQQVTWNILIRHVLECISACFIWMIIWIKRRDTFWGLDILVFLFSFQTLNVTDISSSNSHSGDQEEISGPGGDDYTVYRDAAGGKEPPRLHPQTDCFDHPRR